VFSQAPVPLLRDFAVHCPVPASHFLLKRVDPAIRLHDFVQSPLVAASMSLFWGGFKSRDKTHHCIHEHQSAQPEEPVEEPILEATNQPPDYVGAGNAPEVNPSGGQVQAIARDSKGRCQLCRKEQLAARRYRVRLIIGTSQFLRSQRPSTLLREGRNFLPFRPSSP
jgi:hypothetical protein